MHLRVVLLVAAWLAAALSGFVFLNGYKSTPGIAGRAPEDWPRESSLTLAADRPTLVFLAHPKCVCTRASLAELARLVSEVSAKVHIHIVFLRPEDVSDAWMDTDLLASARLIEGATVHEDRGGVETERFQAATSGQVAIYAPSGDRLFQGGITGARGHEGGNAGLASAIAALRAGNESPASPVFGCGLTTTATNQTTEGGT